MGDGCWFIIGPVAWIYGVTGFIIGIVKTPYLWFKEARKYYEKGLEIERKNR